MSSSPGTSLAVMVLALLLGVAPAHAVLVGYTDRASFDAAISGLTAHTVDFEGAATGTTFASGTGTDGLTFTYAIAGPSTLQVSSTFGTTSAPNYLGLDNPDTAFYLGDSFTINFSTGPVLGVGLYLIAGSDAQAGDLELSVGAASVANGAVPDVLVPDGQAFFLGLVETNPLAAFTSATVRGIIPAGDPNAFLAFTADDITRAAAGPASIPEPGAAGLLLLGIGLLARLRSRPR